MVGNLLIGYGARGLDGQFIDHIATAVKRRSDLVSGQLSTVRLDRTLQGHYSIFGGQLDRLPGEALVIQYRLPDSAD